MVELVTCPRCKGRGDEVDQRKIRYDSLEPPYVTCPECGGYGEVEQEQAENYDVNKSLNDYEADRRFEEWEHRQEEKQDRELDRR
jgi:DnaJ-class molecular chaperone